MTPCSSVSLSFIFSSSSMCVRQIHVTVQKIPKRWRYKKVASSIFVSFRSTTLPTPGESHEKPSYTSTRDSRTQGYSNKISRRSAWALGGEPSYIHLALPLLLIQSQVFWSTFIEKFNTAVADHYAFHKDDRYDSRARWGLDRIWSGKARRAERASKRFYLPVISESNCYSDCAIRIYWANAMKFFSEAS